MATATQPRALQLIAEEHQAILQLLDQLSGADGDRRRDIIDEALLRLDVHQQLKREVLYPALEEVDSEAVEELLDGNDELEELIDELDTVDEDEIEEEDEADEDGGEDADETDYADVVDQMRSRFEEEEQALSKLMGEAEELDGNALGKELESRREELRRELGETGTLAADTADTAD